jgi:hypothetical protein
MIRKLSIAASFVFVSVLATEASALLPTYRCSYDQITDPAVAQLRRQWAQSGRNANVYGYPGGTDPRFWDPTYTTDSLAYAAQGVQVYPGYVDPNNGYAVWKPAAPITNSTPYTYKPPAVFMDGICMAGCYTPDQTVFFEDGAVPIGTAMEKNLTGLMTLTPASTADAMSFFVNKVDMYIVDKVPAAQEILTFRTESGGELKVTLEHPLLSEDGTVRSAREFRPGESLLRKDGSPDMIMQIDRNKWTGKAHNLQPITTDKVSNILLAQGFLSGSLRFQHQWVEDVNREVLRKNVPDDVISVR